MDYREPTKEILAGDANLTEATAGDATAGDAPILVENTSVAEPPNDSARANDAVKMILGDQEPDVPEEFEKLSCLGRGGMGWVFKVRNKGSDAVFSMKVLRPELLSDASAVARFELEIKAASALNHGNLVSIYEFGRTKSGAPFILMDFVDGKSLSEVIEQEGSLDHKRASAIFTQIGEAIAHAHGNGIVHRDLKPSNILISAGENSDLVRVVDFGIARLMHGADDPAQQMTHTGEIFGSPLYMSPEQCRGDDVDRRTDIYAFGCLMYEVLTGKPPFQGENPVQTILKQLNEHAPRFAKRLERRDVPFGLEQIVLHCLQKDADNRYQFMEEVIKDLELVESGKSPVVAVRQSAGQKRTLNERLAKPLLILYATVMVGYMAWLSQFDTLNQIGLFAGTSFYLAAFLLIAYGTIKLMDEAYGVGYRVIQKATLPGDHWLLTSLVGTSVGPVILLIESAKKIIEINRFDGVSFEPIVDPFSLSSWVFLGSLFLVTAVSFFLYLKERSKSHMHSVIDGAVPAGDSTNPA